MLYMYAHIYIYTCVCVYTYIYIYICIYTHTCSRRANRVCLRCDVSVHLVPRVKQTRRHHCSGKEVRCMCSIRCAESWHIMPCTCAWQANFGFLDPPSPLDTYLILCVQAQFMRGRVRQSNTPVFDDVIVCIHSRELIRERVRLYTRTGRRRGGSQR